MLVSSLSFSIMQVFVKLSSEEVGTFEQTFFRNLVSLIIAAVMVRRENLQVFRRSNEEAGRFGEGRSSAFWGSCSSSMRPVTPAKRM